MKKAILRKSGDRNKTDLPVVYYYYRMRGTGSQILSVITQRRNDCCRNIFEYDDVGRPTSMLVVPEQGVNDYQKWLYQYDMIKD